MNSLTVFEFERQEIRFVSIEGADYAVGIDVARALGYKDPGAAVRDKIDKDYTCMGKLPIQGQNHDVTCVSEPGIYQLIFGSKLESAKEFQRWIFEEVLPAIRKTGSYVKTSDPLDTEIAQIQTEIDHHRKVIRLAQKRAELERLRLEVAYIESKPSILLYGRNSKGIETITAFVDECLVYDLDSAVQMGNGRNPQELYFCYKSFCSQTNYEPVAVKNFFTGQSLQRPQKMERKQAKDEARQFHQRCTNQR